MARRTGDGSTERGQASVELAAVLPFVVLAGLMCWQLALAGHVAWMAAHAARAGARAEVVGEDPAAAARSTLPRGLEHGLEVKRAASGRVSVSVDVPFLLHRWRTPLEVSASSRLGEGP
jgi:hypothetical protein